MKGLFTLKMRDRNFSEKISVHPDTLPKPHPYPKPGDTRALLAPGDFAIIESKIKLDNHF